MRWIFNEVDNMEYFTCPECDKSTVTQRDKNKNNELVYYSHCPHCGKKLDPPEIHQKQYIDRWLKSRGFNLHYN